MIKQLAHQGLKALRVNPSTVAFRVEAAKRRGLAVLDQKTDREKLMVNIGGSNFYKRHWKVMDYRHPESRHYDFWGMDYCYDLMSGEPMPLADDSVSFFYSSNTLEHVLDRHLPHLYAEIRRCLKPGGAVRIQVPDYDALYDVFIEEDWKGVMNVCGDGSYNRFHAMKVLYGEETARRVLRGWPDRERPLEGPFTEDQVAREFLRDFAGHKVGRIAYRELIDQGRTMSREEFADWLTQDATVEYRRKFPQEHTLWFNHDKLLSGLKAAGFSEVYRSKAFESRFAEMRGVGKYWGFDHRRPYSSVFVEAVK